MSGSPNLLTWDSQLRRFSPSGLVIILVVIVSRLPKRIEPIRFLPAKISADSGRPREDVVICMLCAVVVFLCLYVIVYCVRCCVCCAFVVLLLILRV